MSWTGWWKGSPPIVPPLRLATSRSLPCASARGRAREGAGPGTSSPLAPLTGVGPLLLVQTKNPPLSGARVGATPPEAAA